MPHVVGPISRIVFCEGRPGSMDDLLLGHLPLLGQVLIQPIGGKYGMGAYIEGYLSSYPELQPDYLGFRDRNFDVEPPELPQLIRLRGEKPIWLSHRTTVENYLIDADLIHKYWVEREDTPAWTHGPALSNEEIVGHIQESARELADYEAVRWALAKLKPGPRWPEIPTTWTKYSSGDIPASLVYQDCIDQACQLVLSFNAQIQDVHSGRFKEYAQTYRQRFNDKYFVEKRKYLVWYDGKDHLVQLCRRLAPNFPRRHYADWAAENVEVSKHPDLQQVVELVSGIG
jgi:hypothetical protein